MIQGSARVEEGVQVEPDMFGPRQQDAEQAHLLGQRRDLATIPTYEQRVLVGPIHREAGSGIDKQRNVLARGGHREPQSVKFCRSKDREA